MSYRAGTANGGLHDLKRPWRYWLWGGDAVEVPAGKTHEEVAECIIPDDDLPPGRTAQSVLLELGAVKQWDLHFISGSKRREALTAVQDQLWRMVEEEVLAPQRSVMLTLGDVYELLNILDVVSARTVNELTTHRGGVRENPRDQSFSWQPWRAWYFQGRWVVLPKDQVHVEVANGLLDVAEPGWRKKKPWSWESDRYLMRYHGAIKQWGLTFNFSGRSWDQIEIIRDRVVDMLQTRPGIDPTDVIEIGYGPEDWVMVTVNSLLEARSLRELEASSSTAPSRNPVGVEALASKLSSRGGCPEIGPEQGRAVKQGVARYVADYGGGRSSTRYLYYEHGEPVAVLQVVTLPSHPGEGVAAVAYTRPEHRRRGLASLLLTMARQDFTAVHPAPDEHQSPAGAAWVKKSFRPNISYLDAVKRAMADAYGEATTENPWESGFLLADGTWLKMGHGGRGDDHRVVTGYVRGKLLQEVYQGDRWNALVRWMQVTKSIRWMPENCSFDVFTKPSREQVAAMWSMARRCPEVTVEQTRGKENDSRVFSPAERDLMVEWVREFWR